MAYYKFTRSSVPAACHSLDVDVSAFLIDRPPEGPLGTYCTQEEDSVGCVSSAAPRRARVGSTHRYTVKLPASVARLYSGRAQTGYLNAYTMAGMITWLETNNYVLVDLRHADAAGDGFWVQYTGLAGAAEVEVAADTPDAYYQLRLKTTEDRTACCAGNGRPGVSVLTIDRLPAGVLGNYVEAYQPPEDVKFEPARHAVLLPPSVARQYTLRTTPRFCDMQTLPGLVTWLADNDYTTIDLIHVFATALESGIWIQYTGTDFAGGSETTRGRGVLAKAAARRLLPSARTGGAGRSVPTVPRTVLPRVLAPPSRAAPAVRQRRAVAVRARPPVDPRRAGGKQRKCVGV